VSLEKEGDVLLVVRTPPTGRPSLQIHLTLRTVAFIFLGHQLSEGEAGSQGGALWLASRLVCPSFCLLAASYWLGTQIIPIQQLASCLSRPRLRKPTTPLTSQPATSREYSSQGQGRENSVLVRLGGWPTQARFWLEWGITMNPNQCVNKKGGSPIPHITKTALCGPPGLRSPVVSWRLTPPSPSDVRRFTYPTLAPIVTPSSQPPPSCTA